MDINLLISKKLAFETFLGQIFIILAVVYLLFFRKKYPHILQFFSKYAILLAFLIALVATSGSLFYSQIMGFEPCELCWFQRIFMYPLVIILGVALYKKRDDIIDYALSLSVIGFFISLYHNYIYYSNRGLKALCQFGGIDAVSCVKRYVFELGYITIPLMALTAFTLIIIFLVLRKVKFPAQ